MKWVEVESSAICAIGYDVRWRCLGIEFREKRDVYFYYDVTASEFQAFLAAGSKGRYLTLVFLPRNHRCVGPFPNRRDAA